MDEQSVERGPCPACGRGRVEITVQRQRSRHGLAVARRIVKVEGCRTKSCRWYDEERH